MERLTPLPWQGELWSRLVAWRERLPHVLLHGGRGVGKRHLLKAFAQLLLCEAPVNDVACGSCAGCRLLAVDNHPDLRWLTPAASMPGAKTRTSVMTARRRSAQARTKVRPSRDRHRPGAQDQRVPVDVVASRRPPVVLLLPAEALNPPAANALLKMLEEPPPGAVFLAASDQLDAVLPTSCPAAYAAAGTGSNACAGNGLAARCRSRSSRVKACRSGWGAGRDRRRAAIGRPQRARPGGARGHHQIADPRAGADRRRSSAQFRKTGLLRRSVCYSGGDGTYWRKGWRDAFLLSTAPAAVSGTGAGDRPAAGGGLDCGTGANAGRQRSSVECAFGSGKRSARLRRVREQKIGVKATL